MKGRLIRAVGIAWLSFALVVALHCPSQAQQPSLSETLAWIESTYNDHALEGGSPGHGLIDFYDNNGILTSKRNDSLSYSQCVIKVHHDIVSEFGNIGFTTYDSTIDLKDIDPMSVKVTLYEKSVNFIVMPTCDLPTQICNAAMVSFGTTSQKPLILDKFEKHAQNDSASTLAVGDIEYAPRFANAFRHAVELCGGKSSPF
jgi:hypothetical protein